ncbi:8872_t:CDS:1, partial [Racocetra fulgida]
MFGKKTSIFKKNKNDESKWHDDDTLIDESKYNNSRSRPEGSVTSSLLQKLNSMKLEDERLKRYEDDLKSSETRIAALREKREKIITSTL